MMTNTERELRRLIAEANFEPITVTMKCNGDEITITPCCYSDTKSFETTEYYLMDGGSMPLYGSDTLDGVAKSLLRYADEINNRPNEIEELKAHIRKYGMDSDWDFVSDFHKDLFGHRPHVGAERLIVWADSDSLLSARLS